MPSDDSRLAWGIAAAAFVVAVLLAGYAVVATGLPGVPTKSGDSTPENPPNVDVTFEPNPDSMTLLFEGGDAVESDEVVVAVDGEPRRTWAEIDVDTKADTPLDAGERLTAPGWEPGDSVRVVWTGGREPDVLATYDP